MKLILTKSETYSQNIKKIILVSGKTLNDKSCSEKPKKLLEDIMEFLSLKVKHESNIQEKLTEIIVNSQEYVMSINNDLNYKLNNRNFFLKNLPEFIFEVIDEGEMMRMNHGEVKNIKSIFLKNLEVEKRLDKDNIEGVLDSAIHENQRVRENLEFCFKKKITEYNDSVNRYHLLSKKLIKEKAEFLNGIVLKGRSGFKKLINYELEGLEEYIENVKNLIKKSEKIIDSQCKIQELRRKNEHSSIILRDDVISPKNSLKILIYSLQEIDSSYEEKNYKGKINDLSELEDYVSKILKGWNIDDHHLDLFIDMLEEKESREMFLITIKNVKSEENEVENFIQVCERFGEWSKIGEVILSVQDMKYVIEQGRDIQIFLKDFLKYCYIFYKREFWVEILNWLVHESIISKYEMNFEKKVEEEFGEKEMTEDVIFQIFKANIGFLSTCFFGDLKKLVKDSLSSIIISDNEKLDSFISDAYEKKESEFKKILSLK